QPHFAEEVAVVEVGDDHLAAVVILDQHRDRALDDVVEGVAGVAGVDDGRLGGIAPPVAVAEKLFEVGQSRFQAGGYQGFSFRELANGPGGGQLHENSAAGGEYQRGPPGGVISCAAS